MKRWGERLAVLAALGFLCLMVWTGRPMQQAQLVTFEAAGVMREPPEAVTALTLQRDGAQRILAKTPDGSWTSNGKPLPTALVSPLVLAIKFLHTARPLRDLGADATDTGYGFDARSLRVEVARAGQPALKLVFGKPGTEPTTQYLAIADGNVWLASRFVGEAWEAVWDGLH